MQNLTVAEAALLAANSLNSLSESTSVDRSKNDRIQATLGKGMSEMTRRTTLADSALVKQYLIVHQGELRVLTRPVVATTAMGKTVYLASLGDALDTPTPVAVPAEFFSGIFVSLTTQTAVDSFDLPVAKEDPFTLEAPPVPEGTMGPPVAAPGPDRLQFTITSALGAPRIAAWPLAIPLPPGYKVPVGKELDDPLTYEEMPSPMVRAWYNAARWLIRNNDGISLHAHDKMFVWASITATGFEVDNLTETLDPSLEVLAPWEPQHGHVIALMREERAAAILRFAGPERLPAYHTPSQVSPPDSAVRNQPAPAPITPQDLTQLLQANSVTHAERELLEEVAETEIRYRLMFARAVVVIDPLTGATIDRQVEYPTLTPEFLAMLRARKLSKAVTNLREQYRSHLEALSASDHRLDSTGTTDLAMMDATFVTCLRNFNWASEPLASDPAGIKDKLGVYHLANPRSDTTSYQIRVESGRALLRQELVGEDKSKLEKKSTELYHNGQMDSGPDILIMLANFWAFGTFAVRDFKTHPPMIWLAMAACDKALVSQMGRKWCMRHLTTAHLFHALAMDIQSMVIPFITIANCLNYRSAVAKGGCIGLAPYDAACVYAMQPTLRLTNIIPTMGLGDYTTIPATIDLFGGEKATTQPKQQPQQQQQQQQQQQRGQGQTQRGGPVGRAATQGNRTPQQAATRNRPPRLGNNI